MRQHSSSIASTLRTRTGRALLPLLASAALVAAASAQPSARGYFRATPRANSDWVRLEFMNSPESNAQNGALLSDVARSELAALTAEQLDAGYSGPLHFTLTREAGVFTFDGKARNGIADGMYTFSGDPRFSDALVRRGYARPGESDRFRLALNNVGLELVDEIKAQGYVQPTTADLVRMGTHGVDLAYLRSMAPIADQLGSVALLTQLRDHGVDLEYVAELERLGYANLSPQVLMRFRDRGIDSVFIGDLARAGYARASAEELAKAREHGVTGSFAAEFQRAGYDRLTLKELCTLKDHGITAAFAEQLRGSANTGKLSADDLVRAKARGVS